MPSATQGVCLQVYDGDWHADSPPAPYVNPMRTGEWWEEDHPIGYRGLHHVSLACADVDDAERFWCELTGGEVTYRSERPAVAATAVGLDIGIPVELIAPTGSGAYWRLPRSLRPSRLGHHLRGARSRGHRRLLRVAPRRAGARGRPDSLMVPPERNLHIVYQFME